MAALGLIFLLAILLIVYGSLYPFDFHHGRVPDGPISMLLHTWPTPLDRFAGRDIAINIFIYLPIGLFGSLWLAKNRPRYSTSILTILFALALSVSMEILQFYDDSRSVSLVDVVTNVTGAALGILLAYIYGKTFWRIMARPGIRTALQPSGAMLLLFCWVAWQVYPLFPQLSRYVLRAKLAALLHTPVPIVSTIGAVVDWLSVAQLLQFIAGDQSTSLILPLMVTLIPARLLILDRSFTWPEIIGALCALALWYGWFGRYNRRAVLLAWLAASMLLVRGLAPYHWGQSPSAFNWTPFRSLLVSDWTSAGLVLFNKTFLYGTAVWLFHKSGYSYLASTIGLAALLGTIEAVQVHLPGRSAEITDPILLMILAVVLKSLDSTDRLAVPDSSIRAVR